MKGGWLCVAVCWRCAAVCWLGILGDVRWEAAKKVETRQVTASQEGVHGHCVDGVRMCLHALLTITTVGSKQILSC